MIRARLRKLLPLAMLALAACSTPTGGPVKPKVEDEPVIVRPVIVAEKGSEEMLKAIALLEEKNYRQAEANFEEIAKVRPDIAEAHFNLGWVKFQLGKFSEVGTHVANGLKLKPAEISAYLLLGLAEREAGQFGNAEVTYRAAMGIAPKDDRIQLNLGILLDLYMQRPDEALVYYKAYQDLQKEPNPKVKGWIAGMERAKAAREAAAARKAAAEAQAAADAAAASAAQAAPAAEAPPESAPKEPAESKGKKGRKGK